ncbi:hypothetical protein Tco_0293795, partial [Tanacetum coccineum]
GRKFAKGEPSVHKDPLFDEIPEDSLDYMETEDAQDVGRTRDVVDEEKENATDVLSTKDVLSTAQQKVNTDKEKHNESTEEHIEGTEEQVESTDGHKKGIEEEIAAQATQTSTQTPTSKIFRDDET